MNFDVTNDIIQKERKDSVQYNYETVERTDWMSVKLK